MTINLNAQSLYQTTSDLRLRSGPGIKYKSIRIIRNGEKVNVTEKANPSWFKIEYEGKTGFVSSKLLIPIVETEKVEETPKIEKEIPKSYSTLPYIIGGIAFVILLAIFSSRSKKKLANNEKKSTHPQTNLKTETASKEEPIQKKQQQVQIEITKSNSDNSNIDYIVPPKGNQNLATNKKTLISKFFDSVATEQLKKEARSDNTTANLNEKQPIPGLILPVKNNEEDIKQKSIDQVIKIDSLAPPKNDDSIIDVTGKTFNLSNEHSNLKQPVAVPLWKHQYTYSFSEINNATGEQIKFYNYFKYRFLKGEYIDLDGNDNYAFLLLFDFLKEYENHENMTLLEQQLKELGENYPKTKYYAQSHLGIKTPTQNYYGKNDNINNDHDYWGLGTKYKSTLHLNDEEVSLLNKLWYPTNNFCSIEFCCVETLKLYLATIASLKEKYIEQQTTLDDQFAVVIDAILQKHFRYKLNSFNYKNSIESVKTEIYSNIFKHCENTVREYYQHKRKINTDTYVSESEVKTEFESKIITKVTEILPTLISTVALPNESTEIELYSQNTNRWKIKFEELISNYNGNTKQFVERVVLLGNLNKNNPSIENIFFEASKFISKHNKETALKLYVRYLYHDLKSAAFDNKKLTKTIQKSLFKSNEQLHEFEIIVSELVKDKDLEKALQSVSKIYTIKRKKIQLDTVLIKEVQHQHSGTVELLNEYLKDEYEDESNSIKTQEINSEEVKIEITQKTNEIYHSIYVGDIAFAQIHTTVLEIFTKSNFSVSQSELEKFAKSQGVFKNQLIESINEICYENLDDVLIEEEDEYYTINPNY